MRRAFKQPPRETVEQTIARVFELDVDDEQIQRELDAAGIDMEPAYKRLDAMVDAKRLEVALQHHADAQPWRGIETVDFRAGWHARSVWAKRDAEQTGVPNK